MKAAVIHSYGGPDELRYEDFADPTPGAGEVLVKVAGASINPVDGSQRKGELQAYFPLVFPAVLGWDVSGTVAELGAGVTQFKVGDRVMAWAFHTYAELCTVPAALLSRVPDELNLADAAALPLATMTGTQLISVASGVQKGQTILISGALGSVARAAVCTAKDAGAIVIAGVQRKQLAQAAELGVAQVVALDDAEALSALPPVDVVANTVRGTTAELLLSKVRAGGTYASVTGVPESAKQYPGLKTIAFVSKQIPSTLDYMAAALAAGRLQIPISQRLPLAQAAAAHASLAQGSAGKILLIP